jgi:UDP-N-acetylmuramate: L-alanyl-gamma-D-glutamyl-meso-diaminopimelate ligase
MTNENNFVPPNLKKIYLMAICGTGMGSLAGLLKSKGYEVAGSDENVYPPMSTTLQNQGIKIFSPYRAENIKEFKPDLVIVGNAMSRHYVEPAYLMETDIPYVSMPQALNHFFLKEKDCIVVSGTHGKTTTTTLMAFLLRELGEDPSYLIGGISQDFGKSFHANDSRYFVIEGDEYDTAFFNKVPKFLHYNPKHVIMTSLEFDHADIYDNLDQITSCFENLAEIIPANGSLHTCQSYPNLNDVAQKTKAPHHRYGFQDSDVLIESFEDTVAGARFTLKMNEKSLKIESPLNGKHNALNVAACFSVLSSLGLNLEKAAECLKKFKGIKRRQEIRFQDENLVVIDDFAHHPTAIKETIAAIQHKFPDHHVIAIFEPRSNTAIRNIFQKEFTESFFEADEVIVAPIGKSNKFSPDELLNIPKLMSEVKAHGKKTFTPQNSADIINHILEEADPPQVALIMSNGGFENIHERLIESYQKRLRKEA